MVMRPANKTEPIKAGAKLDPKGAALIKKMKELSRQAHAEAGTEHVGHVRIMPKNRPPSEHCSCSCSCC
jgi:hypothetical protein